MNETRDKIKNFSTERSFLSGILKFPDCIFEVDLFLAEQDFASPVCSKIYSVLRHLVIEEDCHKLDTALILSNISKMMIVFPSECNISDFMAVLFQNSASIEYKTILVLARDIKLFSIRREVYECGTKLQQKMLNTHNFGNLNEILSVSDEIYFDGTHNFSTPPEYGRLGEDAGKMMHEFADKPVDHVGFSSGYLKYDEMIGYFRPDMLAFVSARAKVGKSMFALNIASHVALKEKIKVLFMDSEMSWKEVKVRLISHIASVDIYYIETGKWRSNPDICKRVEAALPIVENLDITYLSIRSLNVSQILSSCRRFLYREVKRDSSGNFNPCLFIYDYLKLDFGSNLGDNWHLNLAKTVVNFKDFLGSTKTSGLLLGQQNRSGIIKVDARGKGQSTDDESTIAGTDEVAKTCSNTSSLRFKTAEEIKDDGERAGNALLLPILARHGKGGGWCMLSEGVFCRNYINFQRVPEQMSFKELSTKEELVKSKSIGHAFE